jgi:hypothetical protein
MTQHDFEHLFYVEKLRHLTENCPEVAKFITWYQPTRHITVYAVERFYVALVFDLGKRKVEAINVFDTVDYLAKYRSFMAKVEGQIRGLVNDPSPFDNL